MKIPLELKESEFHTRAGILKVKGTFTGEDYYPRATNCAVPDNVTIIPDFTFPTVERVETAQGIRYSIRVFSPRVIEGVLQGEYLEEQLATQDLASFAIPMPGDAVKLTGRYPGIKEGALATIQGTVGEPESECSVVFHPQAFRGHIDAYGTPGCPIRVSVSGGPVLSIPANQLVYTGQSQRSHFWHWRAGREADGDQSYTLVVPLWEWPGLPEATTSA